MYTCTPPVSCSGAITNHKMQQAMLKPAAPIRLAPMRMRRTCVVRAEKDSRAKKEFEAELATDSMDSNILDYCSLNPEGKRPLKKRSLGEKEQEYLDALRAFYYDETPTMSNEEFDNLEQDLVWAGSRVAVLSSTEQKFMEASRAFQQNKPMLTDDQYDELKRQLRRDRSPVVAQGPRCSLRSKRMYSDISVDYLKMTFLNLPAVLLVLGALFSVDDLTGFEITKAISLPEPLGIIFLWAVLLPGLFILANALTQLAFKDALIMKGTCPNCNTENTSYFGDVLTVSGTRDEQTFKCKECKSELTFRANDRMLVMSPPQDKKPPPQKQPKKDGDGKQQPATA